jgi:hypothetical protein
MSAARDQFIADEANRDSSLQCRAEGCPLAWSVDTDNLRLCTAHNRHRNNSAAWPRISAELQLAETRRSMNQPPPCAPAPPFSDERKREILANVATKLRQMGTGDPRRWIERLKHAEERGQPLTLFQRRAWREMLGEPAGRDWDLPAQAAIPMPMHEPVRPYSEPFERDDEVDF